MNKNILKIRQTEEREKDMIVKIVRFQEKTAEYHECDRFNYWFEEGDKFTQPQYGGTLWKDGAFKDEISFKEAYILEKGKTVDHIMMTQVTELYDKVIGVVT